MNSIESTFRRFGSTGLVIFERNGTLLRQNSQLRDLMLGDISNEFVQILRQLRVFDIRFGFISDARGMDIGTYGRSESVALTGLLDELLRVRGAMPDFWMTWGVCPQGRGAAVKAGEERRRTDRLTSGMILQSVEWYGIDKKEAILVNSTEVGLLAANHADISAIHFSALPADQMTSPSREMAQQHISQPETTDTQRLIAEIQRILGLTGRPEVTTNHVRISSLQRLRSRSLS